ncbi:hypothetical protein [Bordetella genomosp. 13]|uniref:hypothetical protein n=1 Tax=Bordetella genomosp. 13 TaxID=463040 RepID=UPI0016426EDA|nr:hypothetical protein [Bordetella genomosp. 13]
MLEEICESLEAYFGNRPDIGVAPRDVAFSGKRGTQPFIDLYEMNEADHWGDEQR